MAAFTQRITAQAGVLVQEDDAPSTSSSIWVLSSQLGFIYGCLEVSASLHVSSLDIAVNKPKNGQLCCLVMSILLFIHGIYFALGV